MKYYLGIDGGGTKTVAAVCDENGNILTKQTGGTINFYSVGTEPARKNLSALMKKINEITGTDEYRGAFIGCSALDSRADDALVATVCAGIIKAHKIGMDSDVYIALRSAAEEECSCVAICGTGSMAIACDNEGKTHISGGWGHVLGDEGSGYAIAVHALRSCCVRSDKNESSLLLEKALEFFGKDDFRQIIDVIYSPDTTKDVIARFSSVVGSLALDGDCESAEIVRCQAEKFAKTVLILLEKSKNSFLGLYGGVFRNNPIFVSAFSDAVREKYPHITIKHVEIPAEESALKLAMEL